MIPHPINFSIERRFLYFFCSSFLFLVFNFVKFPLFHYVLNPFHFNFFPSNPTQEKEIPLSTQNASLFESLFWLDRRFDWPVSAAFQRGAFVVKEKIKTRENRQTFDSLATKQRQTESVCV